MSKDEGLDINVAGEFLVMAATLMEIKSAMLLPAPGRRRAGDGHARPPQELADPRYELVQKLLEYKRFKDSADAARAAAARARRAASRAIPAQARRRRRRAAAGGSGGGADLGPADGVQPADEGGRRPRKPRSTRSPTTTRRSTSTPPTSRTASSREGKLTLRQLIVGRKSRSEMIGVFLALLELIREKKILVQAGGGDWTSWKSSRRRKSTARRTRTRRCTWRMTRKSRRKT